MLNRLTPGAKAIVAQAYSGALRDGTREISEEHLLDALLDSPDGARLLGSVADDHAEIHAEIEHARRRGGLTRTQEAAMAEFGIDLDTVVGHVEDRLGAGALVSPGSKASRWRSPDVSPTVIRMLEEAERHLRASGGRSLGVEHLVLGLLTAPGVVAESFARRGVTPADIRIAVAARHSPAR